MVRRWNEIDRNKPEVLWEKPVTVLLCPTRDAVGLNVVLHGDLCCITPFVTLMSKFNVLCIYVSDFKEPYPARTAYQVAKLPLVRDVLFFWL
jgi:hypothetical protein